ncbi:MAG: hypothetical protein C0624_11000 [Desulfuromonas sp.]|nr:MAG: hypothetical protein C0624_11000 [Desulfuromonas sp.]
MSKDDRLLKDLSRRNWIVLALLTLASLLWRSLEVTQGVLAGGLLAIIAYRWLQSSLTKVISNPQRGAAVGFKFAYFLRLGFIAIALYLLIAVAKLNPVALAVGLSVVVVNILWTTFRRMI